MKQVIALLGHRWRCGARLGEETVSGGRGSVFYNVNRAPQGCEIGRMWQWLMVVVYRVVVVVDLCRLGRPPPWVIEGVIRDFGFLGIYWVILGLGRSLGGVVEGFLGVVGG